MAYQKANIHYLLDKALSCHQYHVHHRWTQRKRELAIVLKKRESVNSLLEMSNYGRLVLFCFLDFQIHPDHLG